MTISTERRVFGADDGHPLSLEVFEPRGDARATVLALPGIGVPARSFRHLGAWLAERRIRTCALDYRGNAGAPLLPGHGRKTDMLRWARDAANAFCHLERHHGAPAIVGHSFGGQALGLEDDLARAPAIVLAASQLGDIRNWSGAEWAWVAAYWYGVVPLATRIFPVVPGWVGLGADAPSGVLAQWARFGRTKGYYLSHVPGAAERLARVDSPILAYGFADDRYAPRRAVADLVGRFTGARVFAQTVEPRALGAAKIGHFGFFRPEIAAPLWREAADFVLDRAARPEPTSAPARAA